MGTVFVYADPVYCGGGGSTVRHRSGGPAGLEERDVDADTVEYAIYGAPGELPELPDLEAAAGGALVRPPPRFQRVRALPVTVFGAKVPLRPRR